MPNTVKEKKHECMSDLRHKRKISNIRRKSVNKRYIVDDDNNEYNNDDEVELDEAADALGGGTRCSQLACSLLQLCHGSMRS